VNNDTLRGNKLIEIGCINEVIDCHLKTSFSA
jgi:hypothetical protein